MKKLTESQLKRLSQLHFLAGELIDIIDDLRETHFFNKKAQSKASELQKYLEPIFATLHGQTSNDTEKEKATNNELFLLHTYYRQGVENLFNLDIDKIHIAPTLLEALQKGEVRYE